MVDAAKTKTPEEIEAAVKYAALKAERKAKEAGDTTPELKREPEQRGFPRASEPYVGGPDSTQAKDPHGFIQPDVQPAAFPPYGHTDEPSDQTKLEMASGAAHLKKLHKHMAAQAKSVETDE